MASIEEYIRAAAARRGINPDIAVKVAMSEGGVKDPIRQSDFKKNGLREPSYGPFQLLVGGEGTGFPAGMGNDFMRTTGLDPRKPENAQAGIDFALDGAAKKGWGAWYGAKRVGLDNFAGIGGNPDPSMMGSMAPPSAPALASATPPTAPVINTGNGSYTAPTPEAPVPEAARNIAGVTAPKKGIADIFSLMALQQPQQQAQPAQIQGPSPEQSQALLNLLKSLNGRAV
jgi:hypothetical protein